MELEEFEKRGFRPTKSGISGDVRAYSAQFPDETILVAIDDSVSLADSLSLLDAILSAQKCSFQFRTLTWEFLNQLTMVPSVRIAVHPSMRTLFAEALLHLPLWSPLILLLAVSCFGSINPAALFLAAMLGMAFIFLYAAWVFRPQAQEEVDSFAKSSAELIRVIEKLLQ